MVMVLEKKGLGDIYRNRNRERDTNVKDNKFTLQCKCDFLSFEFEGWSLSQKGYAWKNRIEFTSGDATSRFIWQNIWKFKIP